MMGLPRLFARPSCLCLSDLRRSVLCKYWALQISACSPCYAASIRFLFVRPAIFLLLPSDSTLRWTLAVQLTLPIAGCVEDFHLQVTLLTTTISQVLLARNAPCLAQQINRRAQRG